MSKTSLPLSPLLALALVALLPAPLVAVPPEAVSAKLAFDEVADGLRQYQKETDEVKGLAWLKRLARTRDPRVTVALGDATDSHLQQVRAEAREILADFYLPPEQRRGGDLANDRAARWWKDNEADLRRRARHLPR
jgi:hypothetical protein